VARRRRRPASGKKKPVETRRGPNESRWVLVFVAFAALRVLASAAAFPFMGPVDETAHCDLVMKYSRGNIPHGLEHYSSELAAATARYMCPEIYSPPLASVRWVPAVTPDAFRIAYAEKLDWAQQYVNKESAEPPLYYALAGLWLWLGRSLGLEGIGALYWVRALAAPAAALLVWLGHLSARRVFPESPVNRLAVPLLLAVFPQDTFYAIAPDMLSPLLFGLGFLGLLRSDAPESRHSLSSAGTGLALAGAVLVKAANAPLVGVAGADALWRLRRLAREHGGRAVLPSAIVLLGCAALPVAAWLAWNHFRFGDWLGTAGKLKELGWTRKSPADWWPHPLFSLGGLWTFWSGLMETFWRGELIWHGQQLSHPALDVFYAVSSAILPLVALLRLPPQREARHALVVSAACLASAVLFLAALSLAFDFGSSKYPSRAHPFFTSGRLLTGALVPFLLLYVHGLDRALWFAAGELPRWLALVAIASAITISEVWLDLGPLGSAFNIIHVAW